MDQDPPEPPPPPRTYDSKEVEPQLPPRIFDRTIASLRHCSITGEMCDIDDIEGRYGAGMVSMTRSKGRERSAYIHNIQGKYQEMIEIEGDADEREEREIIAEERRQARERRKRIRQEGEAREQRRPPPPPPPPPAGGEIRAY